MLIKFSEAKPLDMRYQALPGNEENDEILIPNIATFVLLFGQEMLA